MLKKRNRSKKSINKHNHPQLMIQKTQTIDWMKKSYEWRREEDYCKIETENNTINWTEKLKRI